jgi:hypothetical protein
MLDNILGLMVRHNLVGRVFLIAVILEDEIVFVYRFLLLFLIFRNYHLRLGGLVCPWSLLRRVKSI